jgi:hypothetical protein
MFEISQCRTSLHLEYCNYKNSVSATAAPCPSQGPGISPQTPKDHESWCALSVPLTSRFAEALYLRFYVSGSLSGKIPTIA